MKQLHVFRAGRHVALGGTEIEFSEATVAGIASTYDAAVHEAPIVVGHPKIDAPAYGWVGTLSAQGAELTAEPRQVEAQFAEMVEAGRFKKISAAFYLPGSKAHPLGPKAEYPYLKHVGFLGAHAPAVKGLKQVEFGEDDDGVAVVELGEDDGPPDAPAWTVRGLVRLLRRLRSHIASTDGEEIAERVLPESELDYALEDLAREEGAHFERRRKADPHFAEDAPAPPAPPTHPTPDPMADQDKTAELAERETQLTAREQELLAREQKLKEQEAEALRKEHMAFAEGLADDGARILPRHVPIVAAVLDQLAGVSEAEATVAFGEGEDAEQVAPAEALRRMLGELPQHVDFAERSAPEASRVAGDTVEFAAPSGYDVDKHQLEIHRKAVAYQQAHEGVDYVAAVKAVGG